MHKEGSRTKYRITEKIEVIKKDKDVKMSSNFNFFLNPQIWFNPLLAWNSSEFGGLKTINVSPKKVWLPDIVLYEK